MKVTIVLHTLSITEEFFLNKHLFISVLEQS